MARYGSGSVPIATGWKCTNCRRTHRSSIPRSASGNTRARPALTTDTSRPPRNWSAPCPGSSERCNTILSQSDPICFLFADRYVPLIMRGCIVADDDGGPDPHGDRHDSQIRHEEALEEGLGVHHGIVPERKQPIFHVDSLLEYGGARARRPSTNCYKRAEKASRACAGTSLAVDGVDHWRSEERRVG